MARRRSPFRSLVLVLLGALAVLALLARLLVPVLDGDGTTAVTYPTNAVLQVDLVRVVDGDTIIARMPDGTEERVRYEGIDAPESVKPDAPVEPFGPEATEANEDLLGDGPLRLQLDVRQRDRFGRLLAYVFAGDTFVNEQLVRRGYAQLSTFPPNVSHQEELAEAQRQAQQEGAGLWGR